jgi:hypothetical protein
VPRLDAEAELALEAVGDAVEHLVGHLHDRAARRAHEVLVVLVGEVVHGSPVAEVHVVDDLECLERLQAAVDRRQVDVGVGGLHPHRELVRRDVVRGVEQCRHDRPPGGGDPTAAGPQQGEDAFDPALVRHGAQR